MNHPHELLAELLDGTLDAEERVRVDAHLSTCDACRDDLAAASAGRNAARSLPEAAPPPDLHERVVTAAGGGSSAPRWFRWAGVAAAAALVAAIVMALPDVGGDPGSSALTEDSGAETPGGRAQEAATLAGDVVVETVEQDLGESELRDLLRTSAGRGAEAAALDGGAVGAPEVTGCVEEALQGRPPGELTRLIDARFEGRRARIAVYLEGPGAGEPPDTAVAYVASADRCRILRVLQVLL